MDAAIHTDSCESISIEKASWRDLNELRYIEKICFPKDSWPLWDLIGVLTFPNIVRLKALCDERMVGFVAGDIRHAEKLAWIATICVLPEHRRQGIGTALLKECVARIHEPRIRLSVRKSNQPAIQLYEQLGYHRYGVWPRYYSDGEDALVLEKVR